MNKYKVLYYLHFGFDSNYNSLYLFFKYDLAMHSKKIPIGATIKYGSYVMGEGINNIFIQD